MTGIAKRHELEGGSWERTVRMFPMELILAFSDGKAYEFIITWR